MSVSLCVTPASALDLPDGITDFYDWTLRNGGKPAELFWKAIYGDSWDAYLPENKEDAASKYEEYLNGLETDLGTSSVADNGDIILIVPVDGVSAPVVQPEFSGLYYNGWSGTVINNTALATSFSISIAWDQVTSPVYGVYNGGFWGSDGLQNANPLMINRSCSPGEKVYCLDGSGYSMYFSGTIPANSSMPVYLIPYVRITPTTPITEITSKNVSVESRPASVLGNLGIVGDDGQITKIQDNSSALIDEFNKVYWNPVTNEQQSFTQYTYNYEDRSYNLTMEDGSTVKVVYGDENITINEGDTIYNVYYLSSDSGSGGSGSDGGGSGAGDAISGLMGTLGEIIGGLLTGLINLANNALEALKGLGDLFSNMVETVISFFGGFTSFLGAMFPFLPEETFVILNFGLILLIAAAFFRRFFG